MKKLMFLLLLLPSLCFAIIGPDDMVAHQEKPSITIVYACGSPIAVLVWDGKTQPIVYLAENITPMTYKNIVNLREREGAALNTYTSGVFKCLERY